MPSLRLFSAFFLLFFATFLATTLVHTVLLVAPSESRQRDEAAATGSSTPTDASLSSNEPVVETTQFLRHFPGLPTCEPLNNSNSNSTQKVDVTLVAQTSSDRLPLMKDICQRWNGPISLVVADTDLNQRELEQQLNKLGCALHMVTATVYKEAYPPGKYPVNLLRNMGLRQAETSHALLIDIDLVPSKHLYDDILYHSDLLSKDERQAILVPAFQLNPNFRCRREEKLAKGYCYRTLHNDLPNTKTELLKLYGDPFQKPTPRIHQFKGRNPYDGHSSTGYKAWIEQDAHRLQQIDCIDSVRYEPYLVVRLCDQLPPYQEQFTGYGKNKVSWMWQIQRTGYNLWRLGQGFVIHYPHARSTAFQTWKQDKKDVKKDVGRSYIEVEQYAMAFRVFLDQEVPDQAKVPYCENYHTHNDPLEKPTPIDSPQKTTLTPTAKVVVLKLGVPVEDTIKDDLDRLAGLISLLYGVLILVSRLFLK